MDLGAPIPYLDVRIFDLIVSALILVIGFFLVKLRLTDNPFEREKGDDFGIYKYTDKL